VVTDTVVDALFHQAGVIRTNTLEELFDVAALLAHQPIPRGRRVAILTNAGVRESWLPTPAKRTVSSSCR
jgi:acyl-CoA synthetase (NDP forming)